MTATLSESHDAPGGLPGRLDHFIGGAWSPSADGAAFAVADPVSNQAYAQVAAGAPPTSTARRGPRTARSPTVPGPAWPPASARVLNRIADGIERRGERIAELETFDTAGTPDLVHRRDRHRAVYLRDPDGHRLEVYTSDYYTGDPDHPVLRWDVSDPRRRDFYGHAVVPSWYAEATTVLDLDGSRGR